MGLPLQSNSLQPDSVEGAANNGLKRAIYLGWLDACWLESAWGGKQTQYMFRFINYTESTNIS